MSRVSPLLLFRRVTGAFGAALGLVVAVCGSPGTAGATPYGICAHIPSQEVMDEIVAAGIDWIRIDFVWALVEYSPDQDDWNIYDNLVRRAAARGLSVYATLSGTPQWATTGAEFSGVPTDSRLWQDFCYRAARRYRGKIAAWGLWNEPNQPHFWQGSRTDYINLILIPGATAIRAADPNAQVVAPDLAHLINGSWDNWLESVITQAGDLLDVVAHHAYPSDADYRDVTEDLEEGSDWPWDPPSVRKVLNRTGWGNRPFWLTETGVESDDYGEDGQADFYTGLLEDWMSVGRSRGWVSRVFFYHIMDDPRYPWINYGILEEPPTMTRKQAFSAYRWFILGSEINDARFRTVTMPELVMPGQLHDLVFEIENTGTKSWYSNEQLELELSIDNSVGDIIAEDLSPQTTVTPGQTFVVNAQLAVTTEWRPSVPRVGSYLFARMIGGDGYYFGQAVRRLVILSGSPPPLIQRHPSSQVVLRGSQATFEVEATSGNYLSYQWRRNSVVLVDDERVSGARTARLELRMVDLDLQGLYDCQLTNAAGTVVTGLAPLELAAELRRPASRSSATERLRKAWQHYQLRRPRSER